MLKVVHLITSIDLVNFGVWNSAFLASEYLRTRHEVHSLALIFSKRPKYVPNTVPSDVSLYFTESTSVHTIMELFKEQPLDRNNTVIVSHGAWMPPARVGKKFHDLGFRWIYSPHGMLEPWSLRNHRLKKWSYFQFVERKLANSADIIRAVSNVEKSNLKTLLNREAIVIENGVVMPVYPSKDAVAQNFLFLGRLHFKKGVLPLVQAWNRVMGSRANKKLFIAGPDEGELARIRSHFSSNIEYVGPVYGDDKKRLLNQSHYFLLPSFSEGFPTSVVEAMSYGLIPVISRGCNFPEVFSNRLGHEVEPSVDKIAEVLGTLARSDFDADLSFRNYTFVQENYSESVIANKLFSMYRDVFKGRTS